jgi:hypothetical protein
MHGAAGAQPEGGEQQRLLRARERRARPGAAAAAWDGGAPGGGGGFEEELRAFGPPGGGGGSPSPRSPALQVGPGRARAGGGAGTGGRALSRSCPETPPGLGLASPLSECGGMGGAGVLASPAPGSTPEPARLGCSCDSVVDFEQESAAKGQAAGRGSSELTLGFPGGSCSDAAGAHSGGGGGAADGVGEGPEAAPEPSAAVAATWALAATLDLEAAPFGSAALAGALTPRRALDGAGGRARAGKADAVRSGGIEGGCGGGGGARQVPVVVVVERHRGGGGDGRLHTQVYHVEANRVEEDARAASAHMGSSPASCQPGADSALAQLASGGGASAGSGGGAAIGAAQGQRPPQQALMESPLPARTGSAQEASGHASCWDETDPFGALGAAAAAAASARHCSGGGAGCVRPDGDVGQGRPSRLDGASSSATPEPPSAGMRNGARAPCGTPAAAGAAPGAGGAPLLAFSPLRAMRSGGGGASAGTSPLIGTGCSYAPLSACLPGQHSQASLGSGSSRLAAGKRYSRTAPRAGPSGSTAGANGEGADDVQAVRKNLMHEMSEAGAEHGEGPRAATATVQEAGGRAGGGARRLPPLVLASEPSQASPPLQQQPWGAAARAAHGGGVRGVTALMPGIVPVHEPPPQQQQQQQQQQQRAGAGAVAGPLSRGTARLKGASPGLATASGRESPSGCSGAPVLSAAAAASAAAGERPASPYLLAGGSYRADLHLGAAVPAAERSARGWRPGPSEVWAAPAAPLPPSPSPPLPSPTTRAHPSGHHPPRHRRARSDLPVHYPLSPLESPLHSMAPWDAASTDGAPELETAASSWRVASPTLGGGGCGGSGGGTPLHRGLKSAAAQCRLARGRSPPRLAARAPAAAELMLAGEVAVAAVAAAVDAVAPAEELPGDAIEQALADALSQVSERCLPERLPRSMALGSKRALGGCCGLRSAFPTAAQLAPAVGAAVAVNQPRPGRGPP